MHTPDGLDRRFYELCVLSELKNSLRSGDVWVRGSRQFKDFEEYLLPPSRFSAQREQQALGLAVETDCERFLEARLAVLERELQTVERLAAQDQLPDASISGTGLKLTPLDSAVPPEADALMRRAYGLLPHLKITELLLEVDDWTGFTRHFTHLKSGGTAADKSLLLTAVLADAINLGLTKMAESCPGASYAKLSWLQAWHIRDETYSAALAEVVNAQYRQPFALWWGEGATSSSDGQHFKAGGRGQFAGQMNPRYGSEPGVQFYTHVSDHYAPFHTKVINATVRDATHVLDGLLYHESDLRIEEHYTDTTGFTDHVFALMHLLGFRFAPRIRDLADKRLYIHGDAKRYPTLARLIGGQRQRQTDPRPLGCHLATRGVDPARDGNGLVDAAQARQLPASERPGASAARTRPHRAHSVHARLAARHRVAPPGTDRFEQGRGQECAGPRRVSSTGWVNCATAASRTSATVPAASTWWSPPSCSGHGLPGTGGASVAGHRKRGRQPPAPSVATGLGAHQPDGRLQLAAEQAS